MYSRKSESLGVADLVDTPRRLISGCGLEGAKKYSDGVGKFSTSPTIAFDSYLGGGGDK